MFSIFISSYNMKTKLVITNILGFYVPNAAGVK